MSNQCALVPRGLAALSEKTPALFLPNAKAAEGLVDFFTSNIANKHTRRAYYKAVCRFAARYEGRGELDLAHVKPVHVAAFIEGLPLAKPTVKQHLAALRMLFDWLVVGHVIEVNPAHAVRGPRHVVKEGRTPVLDREEAQALLAAIDASSLTGLRDRALIGTMIHTFARIGAVLQMNVGDYFMQDRCGWVRVHEKGGKEHAAPCHHKLEAFLDDDRAAGPQCEHQTKIGNHSLRATGITDYLKSGGTLEHAQAMANHSSPRTTKLYDRRTDEASRLDYE